MCGIIGYVGNKKQALPVLINGLKSLEYRGYDSAGVAYVIDEQVEIVKEKGKVAILEEKLDLDKLSLVGIGHTRWATHGEANTLNSHPHSVGKVTIVHNGIIENYNELKKELIKKGVKFQSETDSEVACALINQLYEEGKEPLEILNSLKDLFKGAYALGILFHDDLDKLYFIKEHSPLIIALKGQEHYLASDLPAVLKYTNQQIVLEDGDYGYLTTEDILIYQEGFKKEFEITTFEGSLEVAEKNGYPHFMLKEMMEQPEVVDKIIQVYDDFDMPDLRKYKKIDIVACGSAYHAGLVGKYLLETYLDIPVNVEIASEYRYKKLFLDTDSLVILISQSGETADTLAALKKAREFGAHTLAIVNVVGSSIARIADEVLYTYAGLEIAVATTKAYSAQIMIFILMVLSSQNKKIKTQFLSEQMKALLTLDLNKIVSTLAQSEHLFFLGRGIDYALSLEGSLKLKEISYIHSEAYAAGELKHGTISLIEKNTPVIAIATDEGLADKTFSNIKEVKTRGAKVILIVTDSIKADKTLYDELIVIPKVESIFQPLLAILPLQLLAYEVAKERNCDIDKPRNLAKSVTVE